MTRPDGNREALDLLRDIQTLNWDKEKPATTTTLLMRKLDDYALWPASQKRAFARIMAEWTYTQLIGMCYDLDEFEAKYAKDFRRFMQSAIGKPETAAERLQQQP